MGRGGRSQAKDQNHPAKNFLRNAAGAQTPRLTAYVPTSGGVTHSHEGPWTLPGAPARSMGVAALAILERTREAEADIVVAIVRLVPVAVRGAQVPRIVVPGTAPENPVGLWGPSGFCSKPKGPLRKSDCRSRHVSACSACAIHAVTRGEISSSVVEPERSRSSMARYRPRNRATFSSGSRRPPSPVRTTPRNAAGCAVDRMQVLFG